MKMKNYMTHALALGLVIGGVSSVALVAKAATTEDAVGERPAMEGHMHHWPDFMEKVTRTVEKIDKGVIITMTTDDADTLTKLQNMPAEGPEHDGRGAFMDSVTREVTKLDNGIQIKLTSDDASVVEKLQNMPAEGPGHGGPGGHGPFGPFGDDENVSRSVQKVTNGVTITLSSDDAETIEALQSFPWDEEPGQ